MNGPLVSENGFNLGGRIRAFPRDFIVEEVWKNRVYTIGYSLANRLKDRYLGKFRRERDYLHFTMVKRNWETIRSLNYIRRKLGFSLKRFGISGMKDKRAVTAQRVSLWKVRIERLVGLNLKDIQLKDFEYSEDRINLGNACGNRFTITIRDIPRRRSEIEEVVSRFRDLTMSRGIPNLYGPQRMGGGNVEVGRAIKEGDLRGGVEVILRKVKKQFEEGGIKSIPKVFWYEKRMLRHLSKHPNDFAGALRLIPKKILTLYVHAYQSRLFNEQLKQAIKENNVPDTISVAGFETPKMPELRSFTIKRRTYIKPHYFDNLKTADGKAVIRFTLSKGEYASTLLSHLILSGGNTRKLKERIKGSIVTWFNYRGYGFIDVEGQEDDIFVHTSDIKGLSSPKVGDRVTFEIRDSLKGPRAINVEIS